VAAVSAVAGFLKRVVVMPESAPGSEWRDRLADWVARGLIDSGQAARIEAVQAVLPPVVGDGARGAGLVTAAPGTEVRRLPLVVEALGYLGIVVAVAAGIIAAWRRWPTVSAGGELAFAGAGAVVLLFAGVMVRTGDGPSLGRLRSVLWLTSTAGLAACAGTAAGLLTAGVLLTRVLLLGLGALGAIVTLPQVLARYLPPGAGAAGVFAAGLVMPGIALWFARSRARR
jgi:hypothetical protein